MQEQSVIHSTFVIERSYPATPERVFAAFADPAKKRRWFAEGNHHEVEHYELDFRVGGTERARFRFKKEGTPLKGIACTNDTTYQDIVPNRRVVFASTMSVDEKRISASLATLELLSSETGTDLIFTHQGAFFEGADGPEMREAGWRKLLEQLTEEVPR
ncbi:MAG TPA: SRPBCC family protein [Edaphobacter sp.]|nr:SRPBCC family protein [Edaphobacter sp.]